MTDDKTAARGYSWEPFRPGHELSLKHGAWSPRYVDPLAAEMVAATLAAPGCQYLDTPRWSAAVWAWARAEARCELLGRWVDEHGGGVNDDGSVAGALNALRLWEVRAANCRSRLGLDPLSAARLGRDVTASAVDMAKLLSDGGDDAGSE